MDLVDEISDKSLNHTASAVSTIGGLRSLKNSDGINYRTACSSVHFDIEFHIEWVPTFWIKDMEDIKINLFNE